MPCNVLASSDAASQLPLPIRANMSFSPWLYSAYLNANPGYRQFPGLYQQQLKGIWDDADQAIVRNQTPSVGRMRCVQVTGFVLPEFLCWLP